MLTMLTVQNTRSRDRRWGGGHGGVATARTTDRALPRPPCRARQDGEATGGRLPPWPTVNIVNIVNTVNNPRRRGHFKAPVDGVDDVDDVPAPSLGTSHAAASVPSGTARPRTRGGESP